MLILSFESSCDETACAVVEMTAEKRRILSGVVASQISIHKLYGGVVPEIASRAHTEAISGITYQALSDAGCALNETDAIAVTNTPGLIGALLVGVNFAKGLAFSANKPLIPVDHIHAHVAANYLAHPDLEPPFTAFVASGGHSSIMKVRGYTDYETIGATRDDAVGEAFDKVARLLGIPYPGGAEMDKLAYEGDPSYVAFPSAAGFDGSLDMSFSGLKTAVINHIHNLEQKGLPIPRADICASLTRTICSSVEKRLGEALDLTGDRKLVIAGGVSANSHLRAGLSAMCEKRGVKLFMPPPGLCGDNGAMVGAQGYYELLAGNTADAALNAYATKR